MRRFRCEKDKSEKHSGLLKLLQIVSLLVVFVAGVVIGLAASAHINKFIGSQTDIYSFINHFSTLPPEGSTCTIARGCEEDGDCLRADLFLGHKNLTHNMSDTELLWRASLVPMKEDYPFKRLPKVAFMFLTMGPLPMLPLWEKFFQGYPRLFSIYVHATPGYYLNVSITSPFYGRQITSQVSSVILIKILIISCSYSFLC